MKTIARIGAAVAAVLIAGGAAAPSLLSGALDRVRLHDGRALTHGAVHHAGLGLAIEDLALVNANEGLASARRIGFAPALAWPPVRLSAESVVVTRAGLEFLATSASALPAERARSMTKREFGNFHGALPVIDVADLRVAGLPDIGRARVTAVFGDPLHASVGIASREVAGAATLEATQDACTIVVSFDVTGAEPFVWQSRTPAAGWENF